MSGWAGWKGSWVDAARMVRTQAWSRPTHELGNLLQTISQANAAKVFPGSVANAAKVFGGVFASCAQESSKAAASIPQTAPHSVTSQEARGIMNECIRILKQGTVARVWIQD